MYGIIIQPFDTVTWKYKTIDDIKRITIIKFAHKALYDGDVIYSTVFDGEDFDEELVQNINKYLKNNNLITYNGRLFKGTMDILCKYFDIENEYSDNIIALMEEYSDKHNNGKWARLQDALYHYDVNEYVDIYDST
jgi:hypothetical protein